MKCNKCGEKVVKYPLKLQPQKTFKENLEEGTIKWRNFFKIDPKDALILIALFFIIIGFYDYQEQCETQQEECEECMSKPYYTPITNTPQIEQGVQVLEYEGIV